MVAGWFSRTPLRIHWFTGQVWATRRGLARWSLRAVDRLVARLATRVLVDSHSQREFLISEGVIRSDHSMVLAHGSICGVNIDRFRPDDVARSLIRQEFSIPNDSVVLLYLGRMIHDKGVLDLAEAFVRLAPRFPNLWLMLVGPDEQELGPCIREICRDFDGRLRQMGLTDTPERFMASADIFCLPSYREGFGSSVIEAAACGLPTVGTKIYGLVDAVEDGETGFLYPVGNIDSLMEKLVILAQYGEKRLSMGLNARSRAVDLFNEVYVSGALEKFYRENIWYNESQS